MRQNTYPERPEKQLIQIIDFLRGFGSSPSQNIRSITKYFGSLLDATCAFYSRIDEPLLCVRGYWSAPPEAYSADSSQGQLCYDVIREARSTLLHVRNLQKTGYAKTDGNVQDYDLKTYIGFAVFCGDRVVGALCAAFSHDMEPTELQSASVALLAVALGFQEAQRESEKVRYRDIVSAQQQLRALPVAMMLVDPKTHLIWEVNDVLLDLIGAPRKDVVGRLCHRYVCPAEEGKCPMTDLGESIHNSKTVLVRADGSEIKVLKTATKVEIEGEILIMECLMDLAPAIGDSEVNASASAAGSLPKAYHTLVLSASGGSHSEVVSALLEAGAVVHESEDASEALSHMKAAMESGSRLDAVLVDENISGIDAKLFASLVREEEELIGMPLVLLRDSPESGFSPYAAAGYIEQLARPLDGSAVLEILKALPTVELPDVSLEPGDISILIVEDNEINREVAEEMILSLGHRCDYVDNGRAALDAVKKNRYDLILMDCQMPGMDGYETTMMIRAWEKGTAAATSMPIVALTAHAMKGDRERCLACGMSDYMTKPVEERRLSSMINKWLPDKSEFP